MDSEILKALGVDPGIILIVMGSLIILLFILVISSNMKYNRLKSSYTSFMRGKDGKTLEDSILERFDDLEAISDLTNENKREIQNLRRKMESDYQKVGIVKYDAFNEMGGKLSFAVTLLDGNNNGLIINSMHSRDGCYNYVKEIVKGESYIELSEEEAESLEKAIYQESLGLDLKN